MEYLKIMDDTKYGGLDFSVSAVIGDFNNWNEKGTPMKSLKNGAFTATIDLESNKEYQFRYLINDAVWENDWDADKYVPNEYGDSDNSIVVT